MLEFQIALTEWYNKTNQQKSFIHRAESSFFADTESPPPSSIKTTVSLNCGTCSGSCPSGRYTELVTRKIVRNARVGTDVLHDPDLWLCTTCYTCQERCPREIKIADAILTIREIAVHEGIMLPTHRKVSQLMLEHGHAVPINDMVKEKRERLGMDALPETVHKYPEALSEVQTLLGRCGFDKLVAGSQE